MAIKSAPNDLFGTINSIFLKNKIEYDKKLASAYMINLWLSHEKDLMFYCNKINNVLFNVPDKLVYKYFYDKIPKRKRYIKWIKKDISKDKAKSIEEISLKYNISKKEAMLSL